MRKSIFSLLLCLLMLLSLALPVFAEEAAEEPEKTYISIRTTEDFLKFAENCRLDTYSADLVVTLERDIDLGNVPFEGVPIFSGTFLGKGHSINGLLITCDGSNLGLFRYLTQTAVVDKLTVNGTVTPGGSRTVIGGIAGKNEGTITGCSFLGSLSGSDTIGSLVGLNAVTGIVENCRSSGQLHGDHFVGGIAGENQGVIRSCVSQSQVNTSAQENEVEIADITMDTLTNSEAVNTVTDIGGIAGISSGVIRNCENRGNVGYQHMGYNIGGIVGTQSGYITGCANYGNIQGRKEVGGIAGQMEPVALIEYTEDTLQILQDQLGTMSGLVSRASSNAQSNASQISTNISVLREQAQSAKDAVGTLFSGGEELPDEDTLQAAQSTLSSSLSAMPGTLRSISSAAEKTISGLTSDLQAVSRQISAMGKTIDAASENLGGSFTDISDEDTPDLLTGKVEDCTNSGDILADRNVGGIAGAMAMENDLDILEDWESLGEESLNFHSKVRAVILDCENSGTVTGKKQNVGGITGWQSMGLVKTSVNTGSVDGENAEYVGGVSGQSTGFIRSSWATCRIWGSSCVGGIAGSASIATDCASMVQLTTTSEKVGAILGEVTARSDVSEEEEAADKAEREPVENNYYLCVGTDLGAIDGISYDGLAQPLAQAEFLALPALPSCFRSSTVIFRFPNGVEKRFTVLLGGQLDASQIPSIPEKEGYISVWEGLEDGCLTNVLFDTTIEAVYTARRTVIQSAETRENGQPLLLLQGSFSGDAAVSLTASQDFPAGTNPAESWTLTLSEPEAVTAARFRLPDGLNADKVTLMVRTEADQWEERDFTVDESCIVFPLGAGDTQIAILGGSSTNWLIPAIAAAALLAGAAVCLVLRRKKRKA